MFCPNGFVAASRLFVLTFIMDSINETLRYVWWLNTDQDAVILKHPSASYLIVTER